MFEEEENEEAQPNYETPKILFDRANLNLDSLNGSFKEKSRQLNFGDNMNSRAFLGSNLHNSQSEISSKSQKNKEPAE